MAGKAKKPAKGTKAAPKVAEEAPVPEAEEPEANAEQTSKEATVEEQPGEDGAEQAGESDTNGGEQRDESDQAEAVAPPDLCPHCGTTLTPHESGNRHTEGARHCNGCGCCFDAQGRPREGHPTCKRA